MPDVPGVLGGIALLLVGAVLYRYARPISDVDEQLDAIGSTRRTGAVEAADWNVTLTRIFGTVLAMFGALVTLVSLAG